MGNLRPHSHTPTPTFTHAHTHTHTYTTHPSKRRSSRSSSKAHHFVGKDAVGWMQRRGFAKDEREAVIIGNLMVNKGFIGPVGGLYPFTAEPNNVYQFLGNLAHGSNNLSTGSAHALGGPQTSPSMSVGLGLGSIRESSGEASSRQASRVEVGSACTTTPADSSTGPGPQTGGVCSFLRIPVGMETFSRFCAT